MVRDTPTAALRIAHGGTIRRRVIHISIGERTLSIQPETDMANTRLQDISKFWTTFKIPPTLAQDTIETFKASAPSGTHDKPWFVFRSWLASRGRSPHDLDCSEALEFLGLVARGTIDPPAGESKFVAYRAAVNYPFTVMGQDLAAMKICKMMADRVRRHNPRKRRKTDGTVWDTAKLLAHIQKVSPSNKELTDTLMALDHLKPDNKDYRKHLDKLRTKAMIRLECDSSLRLADVSRICREKCEFARGQLFYQVFLTKTHSALARKGKTDGLFTTSTPINTPQDEADAESTSQTVKLYLQYSSKAADQFQQGLHNYYNVGSLRSAKDRRRALLSRRNGHTLAPDLMISGDENEITFFTPLFLSLTQQTYNEKRRYGPRSRFIGLSPETLRDQQKKQCKKAGINTAGGFLSSRHAATSKLMSVGEEGIAVARTKHTTVRTAKAHYTHTVQTTMTAAAIIRDPTIAQKIAQYEATSDISSAEDADDQSDSSQDSPGLLD